MVAAFGVDGQGDLVWKRFTEKPTLESYQRLKRWTSEAGEWDDHRPRAIAVHRPKTKLIRLLDDDGLR